MLSFLRGSSPARTNNAANNPILYEGGRSSVTFRGPGSDYIMTHEIPPDSDANGGVSIITPPFHYHVHQNEFFRVTRGTGNFYMGLDPEPFAVLSAPSPSPSSPPASSATTTTTTNNNDSSKNTARVPRGRYHRFENASRTDPLVVDIHLSPEAYEDEQRFFRNFFGYLDDCKRAGTAPSVFQLLVFLHGADTPLAVPVPALLGGEGVGRVLSRVVTAVVAFWGRWVLGYRTSYGEYYEEGKAK